MQLAISLLNRNGLQDTIDCIDSLLESSFSDYHIYLLDNGSSSQEEYITLENKYWKYDNIVLNKVVTNLGFTGGNNYNIQKIRESWEYNYIMLLNNDCKVEQNFIHTFIEKIENQSWCGIYWPVIKSTSWTVQAIGSYINLWSGSSKRIKALNQEQIEVDYVTGSCMVIPIKVIENVWILDDMFFAYWEESDYCMRAKKMWYKSYALNIKWVYHKEEVANKKEKTYYVYLMFRNRLLFLKKHATSLQYATSWFFLIGYSIFFFPKYFWIKNYKYLRIAIKDWVIGKYGSPSFT